MLTPHDINEHIRKRNEVVDANGQLSPQNYLPLCDSGTNAMILFSFFGNYTWRNTPNKPDSFSVPIRLAFECDPTLDEYERGKIVKRLLNSMRSALSNVRNSMRITAPEKEMIQFKMLYKGHSRHIRDDIIIISLAYTENEHKKTIKNLFKDLPGILEANT